MSLVEIFETYGVPVNSDRQQQKTLCPLGHERHASCSVTLGPDKELWRCHSCGEGGDAITLIMLKEGIDAPTAKRRYQEITGSSHGALREADERPPSPFSGRKGYVPKYRNKLQARPRRFFTD